MKKIIKNGFSVLLSETLLGFLAIVSVALTIAPSIFNLSDHIQFVIEAVQWCIIGLFGIEYFYGLATTADKKSYLKNGWKLIDLGTFLIPLLTVIPGVSDFFRSALLLRLIRLSRVVALGLRATGIVTRKEEKQKYEFQSKGEVRITLLKDKTSGAPKSISWEEFLKITESQSPVFFNISNISKEEAAVISKKFGLGDNFLDLHLFSTAYPHLETVKDNLALFLWFPKLLSGGRVERDAVLLIAVDNVLLTLSKNPTGLVDEIANSTLPAEQFEGLPFLQKMLLIILQNVVDKNEVLAGKYEEELRRLEEIPVRESRQQFFEHTFQLKKELSALAADLWRLKRILNEMSGAGELSSELIGDKMRNQIKNLTEDVEYLYETVVNIREGVLSVIELHLNVVSFEMNRVMRVLAVVSVLGLIPGVVGGMLGMNLIDNPWKFTLPQVAFFVVFSMISCLYIFFVKGWLR
ncbi:MAG: CorA family divalent cation transporter [Verrucomicrobiia bacterium]